MAQSKSNLQEEEVDINSLLDNPRNPNRHPDTQIELLIASFRKRGQYKPVLARRENRMLIAGHGFRTAMQRAGADTIRVAFWDVDQPTADAVMLGDNQLGRKSSVDDERIAELLREIPDADWDAVGFTEPEGSKLLSALNETELVVKQIPTATIADTFWIHVRGPLAMQAAALQKIKSYMKEVPAVTVELGLTSEP